ncbi:MAG: IS1634 family transposase [Acidobacteria bacterium]|nr:IS1634 family transposase [Acidobacteriota bacterium]
MHKKLVRGHPYWYARECQRVQGKPKIVWQKYLGKAEDIAAAMGAPASIPEPKEILLSDFAAPAALYDLILQLDLIGAIDRHAGKRDQGVSVGTYMALAAINRCLSPRSKAALAEWYQGTVLRRLLPVPVNLLTSQRFWDHMSYLDADKISAIEQDLTRTLMDRFQIDLSCLLYDTTNFFTFIDSFNDAPALARRGKSKEKRMDLRIVGLALLVTKDFHIPLLHQVYPGNMHDATQFASTTETLVARYRLFAQRVHDITLVYDKGNNSQENQTRLDNSSYHFVGSLSPVQHPDLLRIPLSRFHPLPGEDLSGVLAWRTRKHVLGAERTILVTFNPELFLTQAATILRELRKRTGKLRELQRHLAHPSGRGKPLTVESVQEQVQVILSGRHMKELILVKVSGQKGAPHLSYRVDQTTWHRLERTLLGKNILFTDQQSWSDEEIVRAYRGQHHIEEAFKRMKNPHFVSWRPLHHWTDQKIRVHAFYCVLALLLSSLLRRTLAQKGIEASIVKILSTLSNIKEVALLYRDPRSRMQPIVRLSQTTPLQDQLIAALGLRRHLPAVGHTSQEF